MRIHVSNSKILLTIVQRGLAIVIVIILFTLGSSIYFYQKIAQSWRDSTYQKADTIMAQMELRVSNYHNIIRTMEDNRQILYLNAQKDQKFSYRETSCIAQLSDLIVNLISPIPEISNIYVYFNRTDLMVDRAGSSNLSAFQRYGGNPSGYDPPNNGKLNQIASVLQNNSQYQSSDPYLFTVENIHYLVFCRRNLAFLIQINIHTLNQQMSRLLPLREAAVQVRWPDGKYLTSNVQEQLSQVFQKENSFTMDRAYGLQYSFHFNKLSYYTSMVQIVLISTATSLGVVCIIVAIMWSLKKHLHNPISDLIQKYHLLSPEKARNARGLNEYSLIEDTLHQYDLISREMDAMRNDLERELEFYNINQIVYGNAYEVTSIPLKNPSYCVVMADFETSSAEKDHKNSQDFLCKLQDKAHVVRILSDSYCDIYMVSCPASKLTAAIAAALKECDAATAICGISKDFTSFHELRTAYRQARTAMKQNPAASHACCCYEEKYDKAGISPLPLYNEKETSFLNSVLSHNYAEMEQYFEQLTKLYHKTSVEQQRKFYIHLYDLLCIILTNDHIDLNNFFNEVSNHFTETILLSYHIPYLSNQVHLCYRKYVLSYAEEKDTLLQMMTDFIEKNIDQNISLQELANQMHLSYAYMGRYFRNHMNMGFVEYVQLQRIKRAKEYLLQSTLSLNEIAQKTGFTTVNSFFRTFKKVTGITPTQFRKEHHLEN